MSAITIDKMSPNEIPQVATTLSHAFVTQPNTIAVWGRSDESARRAIETVFKIAKLNRPYANVLVARRDSRIVGALNMVESSHCQPPPGEMLGIAPRMIWMLKGKMFRAMQIQSIWEKHDPKERHWHLGPIGVLPELQGQGIGSRLLEECCKIIDQKKDITYLETDRPENVPFYNKFGFVITGQEEILGVTNWYMLREAR